jgi:hypothetical protein
MTVRTRPIDVRDHAFIGIHGIFVGGNKIPISYQYYDNIGFERKDSEGHRGWRNPRKLGHGVRVDVGGPFSVQRRTFKSHPAYVNAYYTYGDGAGWWYHGEIHANRLGVMREPSQLPAQISQLELNFIGTKGIRNNPVKPQGNLGQFLGELHDLPKLVDIQNFKSAASVFRGIWHDLRTNKKLPKQVAKAYLNQEFGWKPFVKDLQNYFGNLLTADEQLRQLARDNGRIVHRGLRLPIDTEFDLQKSTGFFSSPSLVSYLNDGLETQYKTTRYDRHRWFSGSFRYWIPTMTSQPFWSLEANTQRNRLSRVVFGASMTPDLLWQLMPWSWLADWGGNVGDIISNSVDIELNNLIIEYAYAMCSERRLTSWLVTGNVKGSGPYSCEATDIEEVKGRAHATPFGFGFDMNSISPYQASILAALGMTKLR